MKKKVFLIATFIAFTAVIPAYSANSSINLPSETQTTVSNSSIDIGKLEKLAKKGDKEAMYELGTTLLYLDKNTAMQWFYKAADAGHVEAYIQLFNNLTDNDERLKYLVKAADAGHEGALNALGDAYSSDGDNYDYEKAKDYYTRAGNNSALAKLEETENVHREERARQQQLQAEMDELQKKADAGDAGAMNKLGEKYYTDKKYDMSLPLFEKAAAKGNAKAMYNIGESYYSGNGTEEDLNKAFQWYKKAESNGLANDHDLLFTLGYMYAHGQGTTTNLTTSRKYLEKALAAGNQYAQKELNNLSNIAAAQEKKQIMTRKPTNIRVQGHTYAGKIDEGQMILRFEPNGRVLFTVRAYGRELPQRFQWSQNGTEITITGGIGKLWLDSKGNLHQWSNDGDHMILRRTK